MADEAKAAAAAALTAGLLADFASDGDEHAAELLTENQPAQPVAAAPVEAPSSPPQTAAQPAAEPAPTIAEPEPVEFELPSFDPVPDDELDALLEQPDFAEEAAAEVAAEMESEEYEYQDPEVAKQLRELKKRNEWLEGRLVDANKRKWIAENLRKYPLLAQYAKDDVDQIDASSRRQFAVKAAQLNERMTRALKPALDDIAKARAALKTEVQAEARQEVRDAWGQPVAEPAGTGSAADQAAALDAARKTGKLKEQIKVLMSQRPVL